MFRYRLFEDDGSDAGDIHHATPVEPGETIRATDGRWLRVLDVIRRDESAKYAGFLMVTEV